MRWDIEQQAGEPYLIFSWKERDGPPVKAPAEAGFGSTLIAATLSRAPRISYAKEGFEFTAEVPLSEVLRENK